MRRITLHGKIGKGKYALVDNEDYERANKLTWYMYANKNRRNVSALARKINGKRKTIYLHRFIVKCPDGYVIDHKDHNGLNNQKSNLRVCTPSQNQYNQQIQRVKKSSVYKGVCWLSIDKKWVAKIACCHRSYTLGTFKNEKDAAIAYNKKAQELFGEFAYLNKI